MGVWDGSCICCNREIPKSDSVFDPRQKGLLNQKWLQKNVSHFLATILPIHMREIPLTAQTSRQHFQDLGEILTELTQSGISKNNQFNTVLSVLETINDVYFAQALLRNATSTL